jgi:hypothetical protein
MTSGSGESNPFLSFTDADLSAALLRAIRTVGILTIVGCPVIWIASGWQTAGLFLVGAGISVAGVYESLRLIRIVNAKLDQQKASGSTSLVLALFFLRWGIAAVILYASLKCLHGSVYGLIAGLVLAMIALSFEAVKLTRA